MHFFPVDMSYLNLQEATNNHNVCHTAKPTSRAVYSNTQAGICEGSSAGDHLHWV